MTDESVAAVAVALAMALDNYQPGLMESFNREAERLFRIVHDALPKEQAKAYEGGLMAVGHLLRTIKRVKLEGGYEGYDTYAG